MPSPSYFPVAAAGRDVIFKSITVSGTVRAAFLKTTSTTEHTLTVYSAGTTGTGVAINAINDRPGDSTIYATGQPTGRGVVKITTSNPGPGATANANAAGLSIDIVSTDNFGADQGGTAGQGIFVTSTTGGTTGRLLTLRNGGANLVTVPAAGSIYTATGAFGAVQPVNHGVQAWAFDPVHAVNSSLLTNGTVYLTKLHIADDVSITHINWWVTTAGATPSAGQNEVGLYSSAGVKLASVNVDADISSTGMKTSTIAQQNLTAGSFVWVAMVFNAATAPTIARATGSAGVANASNLGLTASVFRYATNGTGQAVLPANITPSSNAAAGFAGPWAAIAT